MKPPRKTGRFKTKVFDLGSCRLKDLDSVSQSLAFAEGEGYESRALLAAINQACDDRPDPEEEDLRRGMRLKQSRLVEGER